MTSITFFFLFIPILAFILLAINLIFAPHNPYKEKNGTFECGFTSFLGQNRTQFSISFFIFALLFLLFDLEILLVYPYLVSSYTNETYGLVILLIFLAALTSGFVFELGKKALSIDSRQVDKATDNDESIMNVTQTSLLLIKGKRVKPYNIKQCSHGKRGMIGDLVPGIIYAPIIFGMVVGILSMYLEVGMIPFSYDRPITHTIDTVRELYPDFSNTIRLFDFMNGSLIDHAIRYQLPRPADGISDIPQEHLRSLRSFVENINRVVGNSRDGLRDHIVNNPEGNLQAPAAGGLEDAFDRIQETIRHLVRSLDNGDGGQIFYYIRELLDRIRSIILEYKLMLVHITFPNFDLDYLPDAFWRSSGLNPLFFDIYAFNFNVGP